MLQVHTRWVAAAEGPAVDTVEAFASDESDERDWGRLFYAEMPDPQDALSHVWMLDQSRGRHRVAVYEVRLDNVPSVAARAIGVASPFPIDTALFLERIAGSLRDKGVELFDIETDLSPLSLQVLDSLRIDSIRFEGGPGQRVDQFSEPVDPASLDKGVRISAVTALLFPYPRSTVVNLFDDNQFYVADSTPELVGEVAHHLSSLWRMPSAAML